MFYVCFISRTVPDRFDGFGAMCEILSEVARTCAARVACMLTWPWFDDFECLRMRMGRVRMVNQKRFFMTLVILRTSGNNCDINEMSRLNIG
jgi:hypothetical protein